MHQIVLFGGEIGASSMKKRMIDGRLKYIKTILSGQNQTLKNVLSTAKIEGYKTWMIITNKYLKELRLSYEDIGIKSENELKNRSILVDNEKWKNEINSKKTLAIYKEWKKEIREEKIYDNRPASEILYRARSNCLPLEDRKRHQGEDIKCKICNAEKEDMEHFILFCPEYENNRMKTTSLQKPYHENTSAIVGHFLFGEQNLELNKEILYEMWKVRNKKIEELNTMHAS